MVTPVFVVTGFLDSGKTTMIKETLMEQEWIEPGLTLLLMCEEGEEEYTQEYLDEKEMVLLKIDDISQLNTVFFKNCEKNYHPAQIVIEYNGMWKLEDLLTIKYPRNFELQGVYSTVDGTTLDMYLTNMRNMLMEQLAESELIVVNRCAEGVDRSGFRRALKVQNPMAQLIFEGIDGKIIEPSEEDLPYDVKGDKIVIEDMDFGIWYVDAYDHPELYLHKEIEFKAQTFRPRGMKDDMFVPVRQIMTCCAADVRYYGYPCKAGKKIQISKRAWVRVRARFEYESLAAFGSKQPVLYLIDMEPAEKPSEEVVYLG
ncbi:GTP-binding protein [Dorea sp. YH-dor226]|uniref:TIGR03943 family putative permease subunit n=1 Tax=Dorea sp. YH-dor226 TaxID=3151119 RepID=UPI003242621E